MKKRIILRADANEQIATGHVFRLLSLAELLNPAYEVLFCTQTTNQQILDTIAEQVDQLLMLPEKFEYCSPKEKELNVEIPFDLQNIIHKDDIVVTDGYWFRENYQQSIKKQGAKLVMIDDFANQHFYADAVINHAPFLRKKIFSHNLNTNLYLGLKYALLRKHFYEVSRHAKIIDGITRVFICFGGGVYDNIIEKVIQAFQNIDTVKDIHLVSSSNKRFKSSKDIFYYPYLTSNEISELMRKCHLSVCPASTISIESFFLKMFIMIGLTADNQKNIHNGLVKYNNVDSIGDWNKETVKTITKKLKTAINNWEKSNFLFNYSFNSKNLINIFKTL